MSQRNFKFITEVEFENDQKSIPFKCWSESSKVYVKLNIDKGGTLCADFGPTMSPDGAQLFIQEAIPALLEKESTLIKEYLKI